MLDDSSRGSGKRSSNLYVCGLDADIDDAKFEEVFSKFGTVVSAKVMVDIHTGVSRGFGFILFETLEQGVAAQEAMNGRMVMSKPLTVRYSGQHQTTHLLAKQPSMYVRNVPRMTPREALLKHFCQFGTVVNLEVLRDTAKGANGLNSVLKMTFAEASMCDAALRATHCKPNPFADFVPKDEPPASMLVAKFSEPSELRSQRRFGSDRGPDAPPPKDTMLPLAQAPLMIAPPLLSSPIFLQGVPGQMAFASAPQGFHLPPSQLPIVFTAPPPAFSTPIYPSVFGAVQLGFMPKF